MQAAWGQQPPTAERDVRWNGRATRTRSTEHFRIESDAPESLVDRLAVEAESTYAAVREFARGLQLDVRESTSLMRIVFFDQLPDFRRYAERLGAATKSPAGFYDPTQNLAILCNVQHLPQIQAIDEQLARRSSESPQLGEDTAALGARRDALIGLMEQTVVRHETAHLVLANLAIIETKADNPVWLLEGLACLFEPRATDDGPGAPPRNTFRQADLCQLLALHPAPKLADCLARIEWSRGEEPLTSTDYAMSWAVLEFLRRTHPTRLRDILLHQSNLKPKDVENPGLVSSNLPLSDLEPSWAEFLTPFCRSPPAGAP